MTAATLTRSAYPPVIEDLMPRAVELTQTLEGELPSRNRLMKELHIGPDKAKLVLLALGGMAEQDEFRQHLWLSQRKRGGSAPPPPMNWRPAEPEPKPETLTEILKTSDSPKLGELLPADTVVDADPVDTTPVVAPAPSPIAVEPPVVRKDRRPVAWPVLLLALPAFVAIWSGWVSLGELSGFGMVHPLPGIADHLTINTAITLPVGVETYAAYALWVWLSGRAPVVARQFARWSAIGSLLFGAAGQITYHLMVAAGMTTAPWLITAAVACLPVAVLGMGAALAHLLHNTEPL